MISIAIFLDNLPSVCRLTKHLSTEKILGTDGVSVRTSMWQRILYLVCRAGQMSLSQGKSTESEQKTFNQNRSLYLIDEKEVESAEDSRTSVYESTLCFALIHAGNSRGNYLDL